MTNIIMMQISLADLCAKLELEESMLLEVIEHGIAAPIEGNDCESWIFDINVINVVEKAHRLRRDLQIEWAAIALVMELLQQRDQLEVENAQLRQQLSRFLHE